MDEQTTTATVDSSTTDTATGSTTSPETVTNGDQTATSDNLDSSGTTSAGSDQTEAGKTDTTPVTALDADIDEWAVSTKRKKPENDAERALLQEIRNDQREYSRGKQAKEALKTVEQGVAQARPQTQATSDVADPLEREVQTMRSQFEEERSARLRSEYFSSKNITVDEGKVMADILKEKVDKANAVSPQKGTVAFEFWSDPSNLEDLYTLAQARMSANLDTSGLEAAAATRERERIAKESQANSPGRNAKVTQTQEKTEESQRLERFSHWP